MSMNEKLIKALPIMFGIAFFSGLIWVVTGDYITKTDIYQKTFHYADWLKNQQDEKIFSDKYLAVAYRRCLLESRHKVEMANLDVESNMLLGMSRDEALNTAKASLDPPDICEVLRQK